MEYIVSIRIAFPEEISKVLKHEKGRFVAEYGSSYKSEPHISTTSTLTQTPRTELCNNPLEILRDANP
ncbi:MAG: hypothetical protein G01um101444_488 [Parcubacteria group bacterium Gr01-1014_44]|nr:MAG: hypothetical protein G01um101444_488 [Parcubacteria group bacterium Gr01-1014_44]